MNKSGACVLAVMLFSGICAVAQSPIDGTWKTNMAQMKFSPKPITFYISEGWYHCVSCTPAFDAKADGTDQPVTGQTFDTINVKEVDPNTISLTTKKDGKITNEQTRTVSADGKTLTVKITGHPQGSDKPVEVTATAKRTGVKPSGVQATSGEWQILKENVSDNGVTTTYKVNGDELTMSTPTGESFTAKLDGTDAPFKGSYGIDTVSMKKINDHTFEETDKRNGTVVEVVTMTITGKTMKVTADNKLSDRTTTSTATKQ